MDKSANIENSIKEKKKKFFLTIVVMLVSVAVLVVIVTLLFRNTKINQGKFRVADAIITCGASLEDKSNETGRWTYNVSQSNTLSLLISTNAKTYVNAYITDFVCDNPNVILSQKQSEDVYIKANTNEKLDLTSLKAENTILYEINMVNKDVLNMYDIPQDVTEIKHDATIFKIANITTKDLKFNIQFNFNMQESNGKVNTMHIKMTLPNGDIVQQSNTVTKLRTSNFVFRFQ